MTTNDMYNAALANMKQTGEHYGVSRLTLTNGDELICYVRPVAGASVRAKHLRTDYSLRRAGEQYAKPWSRALAAMLLKNEQEN